MSLPRTLTSQGVSSYLDDKKMLAKHIGNPRLSGYSGVFSVSCQIDPAIAPIEKEINL